MCKKVMRACTLAGAHRSSDIKHAFAFLKQNKICLHVSLKQKENTGTTTRVLCRAAPQVRLD
jgi:hypothetical protein